MANDPVPAMAAAASWLRGLGRRDSAVIACVALAAAVAAILFALPAVWYITSAGADSGRHHDILSDLAELSALDARWEHEAWRTLNDFSPAPTTDRAPGVTAVTARLDAAARLSHGTALRTSLPQLVRALTEKAAQLQRFRQAHEASHRALREALSMETEMAGLVREAWREAPHRQRLVAADNVITQLLADIQHYYFVPADSVRKKLEASAADLRSAAELLPDTLRPAVARLERHVGDLLRARPAAHAEFDRLRFHVAGPLVATLAREVRREFDLLQLRRARYRVYLAAYFSALLLLAAYGAARITRRELVLRRESAQSAGKAGEEASLVHPTPPATQDVAPGL